MAKLKWTRHSDLAIRRTATVGREEFLDYMTFQRNDRPLFTEIFGPLIGLKEEWEAQGATPRELDFSSFRYRCPAWGHLPVSFDFISDRRREVLQESEEFLIYRDEMGRTMKLAKGVSTLPLPMDHPVANMDDWRRIKAGFAFSPSRLGAHWQRIGHEHLAAGRVTTVEIPGGYDIVRQLMGDQAACIAFIEQGELVADILRAGGDMVTAVLDAVTAAVPIDMLSIHEDMAGRSGPMIGPAHVREFLGPYYRRVWDLASSRGSRLFDQDSDGNMNPLIEAFLDCGVNCMHPFEPAAGMDIVQVRQRYGRRLAFYGGLDKHVLRRSQSDITAQLEYKIPPMVETGGCMLAMDHRIPNGTPLANYRFYIAKAWEIMDRCTFASRKH